MCRPRIVNRFVITLFCLEHIRSPDGLPLMRNSPILLGILTNVKSEEKPQQAGRRRRGFYVGGSGGEDGPTPQEVQVSGVR